MDKLQIFVSTNMCQPIFVNFDRMGTWTPPRSGRCGCVTSSPAASRACPRERKTSTWTATVHATASLQWRHSFDLRAPTSRNSKSCDAIRLTGFVGARVTHLHFLPWSHKNTASCDVINLFSVCFSCDSPQPFSDVPSLNIRALTDVILFLDTRMYVRVY
jgi:hypothetical protein